MSRKITSSKRSIERRVSSSSEIVNTSVSVNTIHTPAEAETLIRTLLEVSASVISSVDTDIENVIQWILHVRPQGVTVSNPTVTEILDQVVPLTEIARGPLQVIQNATTGVSTVSGVGNKDIKAMRKLKKGDLVTFTHIGLEASNVRISWIIYQWFKD